MSKKKPSLIDLWDAASPEDRPTIEHAMRCEEFWLSKTKPDEPGGKSRKLRHKLTNEEHVVKRAVHEIASRLRSGHPNLLLHEINNHPEIRQYVGTLYTSETTLGWIKELFPGIPRRPRGRPRKDTSSK